MSNNRPSITALKCPKCQAEITRFRTRHIPAYILDVICPACGKAHRHIKGYPADLTKKIREWIPDPDTAPKEQITKHPGPPIAALPIPDPKDTIQATLNATVADPDTMKAHIANVEKTGLPDALPANVDLSGIDLTAMKAQAEKMMASLTPEQKQKMKDALDGKI